MNRSEAADQRYFVEKVFLKMTESDNMFKNFCKRLYLLPSVGEMYEITLFHNIEA